MSSSQQQRARIKEEGEEIAKQDDCSSSSSARTDDSCRTSSPSPDGIVSSRNAKKGFCGSPLPDDVQQRARIKEEGEEIANQDDCSSSSSVLSDDSCRTSSPSPDRIVSSRNNAKKGSCGSPLPDDVQQKTRLKEGGKEKADQDNCSAKNGNFLVPLQEDVILGRGIPAMNHPGNRIMLDITLKHKKRYLAAKREHRRKIGEEVLDIVLATGARFLRRREHGQCWEEVHRTAAYNKVSHALRNKKDKRRSNESRSNAFDLTQGADNLIFRRDPNVSSLLGSTMLPPSMLQPRPGLGITPGLGLPLLSSPSLLQPLLLHPGYVPPHVDCMYALGLHRSPLYDNDAVDRMMRARVVDSLLRQQNFTS